MSETKKYIENLNIAKLILCNQQMLTPEMCIRIGQAVTDAISLLKEKEAVRCKNCRSNHQRSIQFKFADADDEEEWFCGSFSPSSGQAVKWECKEGR